MLYTQELHCGEDQQQLPTNRSTPGVHLEYSVKVINPSKKCEYEVHKLRIDRQFSSVVDLKQQLMNSLQKHVPESTNFHVGYIEPGKQGIRGKSRWIFTEEDLADMYSAYAGKSEIILWCDGRRTDKASEATRKRAGRDLDESTIAAKKSRSSLSETQSKKLSDVQVIYEELSEKHRGNYSDEQLRTWAHLIQMGKHSSYEKPPDKPFFRGAKLKKSGEGSPKKATTQCESAISPLRRANLRTAYMSQVKQWHDLLEAGAITIQEYEEHKNKILGDLHKL